ncbi:MAG: UDP-N-acetylmuramate--L-alanine ligase [Deltaproteobacteria bacterium]|jgi:UDP-N-acetylmuramate--alanine ligase|nr:UDP-N-acetylmuramate--L-alanine ligase [Deltaproteobacteria bacterium]
MYRKKRHIHFVGIGGIGMSGIAEVLLNLGHEISGSDLSDGAQTRSLSSMGADVRLGHRAENIEGADVVVVSSAVGEDNPEVKAARAIPIPVIPRAEMLSELMRLKSSVAVAGSHGKTSTCSMLGTILTEGGLDPTLIIGGKVNNLGLNARLGQGELLVAEADESDGSFLLLSPTISVVTNIDREHMNYYQDLRRLKETFLAFINKVPFYGASILCQDDEHIRELIPQVKKRFITYGLKGDPQVTAKNILKEDWGHSFELVVKESSLGRVRINLPGLHNVLNALAASAVSLELGLDFETLKRGISKLSGVGRRFEHKGDASGVRIFDDYGHHPTEIKATLATLSECFPERRKIVLFQPHRHSRTQDLFSEFAISFGGADLLILADIYSAGERGIDGVNAESLAKAIRDQGHGNVSYGGNVGELARKTLELVKQGDVILTLGAGNIWEAGEEILRELGREA